MKFYTHLVSVSLYAYFRDSQGKPLTPRGPSGKPLMKDATRGTYWGENVITRVIRHSWKVKSGLIKKEIHLISTPRVVVRIGLNHAFLLEYNFFIVPCALFYDAYDRFLFSSFCFFFFTCDSP